MKRAVRRWPKLFRQDGVGTQQVLQYGFRVFAWVHLPPPFSKQEQVVGRGRQQLICQEGANLQQGNERGIKPSSVTALIGAPKRGQPFGGRGAALAQYAGRS